METAYDASDRVTTVTEKGASSAEDLMTTHVYTEFGDLFRTILPEGNLLEYGYDAAGRLVTVESKPDELTHGELTLFTLDAAGNRIRKDLQSWDGTGWLTESFVSFEYSSRCRLDKIRHADGTVTEYAYDCNGNVERMWDANHPSNNQQNPASTVYGYDVFDRLVTLTQPWGGAGGGSMTSTRVYDVQDNLTQLIDANGTVTSLTFSDRHLLTLERSEVKGDVHYFYNEHGEMIRRSDARGIVLQRTVDALDRVVFDDYPDNSLDVVYHYDEPVVPFSKGRMTGIERDGQRVELRFDRFGRRTQDGDLKYALDCNGNVRQVAYPGGVTASYAYDFNNRPVSLTIQDADAAPAAVVTAAQYKPAGPLTELRLGNGLTEERSFDNRYFPTGLRIAGRLDWTYSTDSLGNVLAMTDNLDPAASRSYTYQDYQNFLTSGIGPWGSLAWTYDKMGNRLTETRDGSLSGYVYAANDAGGTSPHFASVLSAGASSPTQYVYDAMGSLTHEDSEGDKLRYSYDVAGRLSQIRQDRDGEPSALSTLRYDGRGLLTEATLQPAVGPPLRNWRTQVDCLSPGKEKIMSERDYMLRQKAQRSHRLRSRRWGGLFPIGWILIVATLGACGFLPGDPYFSVEGSIAPPAGTPPECILRILDPKTGEELLKRDVGWKFTAGTIVSPSVKEVDVEVSCLDLPVFLSTGHRTEDYLVDPLDLGVIELAE